MTVIDRLRDREAEFADRVALVDGATTLRYTALYERVDRFSQALLASGFRKGDTLVAWLPNCHQAIECELGCLAIGAVWVTLNTRLTFAEVAGVLRALLPRCIVTDRSGLERFDPRFFDLDSLPPLWSIDDVPTGTAAALYEQILAAAAPERPRVEVGEEDVARFRYTSGTTGHAKAAVLPHRVYSASLDNLLDVLHPLGPQDRALHAAPLTHASGALVFPLLYAGGTNIIHRVFDIGAVLTSLEADRITTLFAVPTILQRLAHGSALATIDLSHVRALFYGGAPMPEAQLRPIVAALGHALVHIYGMTEAPWPITTLTPEDHHPQRGRIGSIGRPTSVCDVEVRDEAGARVADGEVGELTIRGRNVMRGYWEDPEATADVLRDGWLSSGDLGYRDRDGYFYIVDRKKDVIISGGFNVYATEVEMTLCEHPAIAEAAVVGVPHEDWGELVVAFLVERPGVLASTTELSEYCRERMSAYKRPKRFEVLTELPKNPSGKIDKRALRERGSDG